MENLNVYLLHRGKNWSFTAKWEEVLDGRSYIASVTKEHIDTVTQEELNAYDLAVIAYEVFDDESLSKVRGLTAPILNLDNQSCHVIKISSFTSGIGSRTSIKITDNSHAITSIYRTGHQRIDLGCHVCPDGAWLFPAVGYLGYF